MFCFSLGCGAVDTVQKRDGSQRVLDRFERWSCVKVQQGQVQGPAPGSGVFTKHKHRLGVQRIDKKDLGC